MRMDRERALQPPMTVRAPCRLLDLRMPEVGSHLKVLPWLIGQERWFVLGYQFAGITNTSQYRDWLRHTFTDEMLGQWRRTHMCQGLPAPWQATLATELRRRGLVPCTRCAALIPGRR